MAFNAARMLTRINRLFNRATIGTMFSSADSRLTKIFPLLFPIALPNALVTMAYAVNKNDCDAISHDNRCITRVSSCSMRFRKS